MVFGFLERDPIQGFIEGSIGGPLLSGASQGVGEWIPIEAPCIPNNGVHNPFPHSLRTGQIKTEPRSKWGRSPSPLLPPVPLVRTWVGPPKLSGFWVEALGQPGFNTIQKLRPHPAKLQIYLAYCIHYALFIISCTVYLVYDIH